MKKSEPTVRSRAMKAPIGPVTIPDHVRVQVCPGYERVEQRRETFIGAFGSSKIGSYPFEATWSAGALGDAPRRVEAE